ncbi:alpha-1,2-mannosyltransferase alg11, putative [Entamoeba histolytica HM-1:IMSS-B]|uniref:GDP-Man:Man(3)GlcNAc(2)-PP-Dol alpha-1,2-mannosyltransferase n=6 Tax=Entamoeba histolytica TaxID=5759 RepID=C4LYI6_ENTH1|nr:glycosyltransferase, putative [Entamoeba histolytica HM-1:IMSS]EMD42538.1 glycosyl transferase, putative [Entamoeba histolytica KU27]EMH78002.1 alpha-1,2-mannosyltransferase alg11, putative [Entamoeba histolytica HM-1:IMSS-B]EMS12389.1 glycosyl transferase [Entamoeba histolytica HM-3:IMSS]ENY63408.1 glycosyl transferase, putative [Entamoeba histolytica HM-1:IMSS-A]GAT93883.1 alpha 1 2-mannosyltransferase alg11 putative [Entamoeba histolytica]|eukprot:XP_657275.1 glycosyltransferase, putative [Entamoeba histolytica HM-1:IMSS]
MVVLLTFCILLPIIILILLILRFKYQKKRTIAFFHPNCSAGGGGEMVLWVIIKVLLQSFPNYSIVIFTADTSPKDKILEKVKSTFGFDFLDCNIKFYQIKHSYSLVIKKYPFLTLFFQAIGSMICCFDALIKCNAEYFFDTTGCAFTYPFAWLAGAKIMTYTHYPTISTDMLNVVQKREVSINNTNTIARSSILSTMKVFYYKIFAYLYYLVGNLASLVFVNGTWTKNHISQLWKIQPHLLYPPCDINVSNLNEKNSSCHLIISIGQFRPEKRHLVQIEAINILVQEHPEIKNKIKFVVIGGARDAEDLKRKEEVIKTIEKDKLTDIITVPESTSYEQKIEYLKNAEIGLHTMVNEHFGICVVEYMGFGVIPVAHKSAGPELDIVDDQCGYLATTPKEYADAIFKIINDPEKTAQMRQAAIQKAKKFSVSAFEKQCEKELLEFLK